MNNMWISRRINVWIKCTGCSDSKNVDSFVPLNLARMTVAPARDEQCSTYRCCRNRGLDRRRVVRVPIPFGAELLQIDDIAGDREPLLPVPDPVVVVDGAGVHPQPACVVREAGKAAGGSGSRKVGLGIAWDDDRSPDRNAHGAEDN